MPRTKSQNPKSDFIRARVTQDLKRELGALLAQEGKKEADFLRECALSYIASRKGIRAAVLTRGSGSAGAPAVPDTYIGDPLPAPTWTGDPLPDRGTTISAGTIGTAYPGAIAYHGDPKTNGVDSTPARMAAAN